LNIFSTLKKYGGEKNSNHKILDLVGAFLSQLTLHFQYSTSEMRGLEFFFFFQSVSGNKIGSAEDVYCHSLDS
jgi:hypothetical protein